MLDDLDNPQPLDKLPTFHAYFSHKLYQGEPYALAMHSEIFYRIADAQKKKIEVAENGDRFMDIEDLPTALECFFAGNKVPSDKFTGRYKMTVAGKNAAMFDLPFLKEKISNWGNISFLHRVLDPAILYFQPGDESLPDMKLCMERAGIAGEVAHTAIEDALTVVKLLRYKLSPQQNREDPTQHQRGSVH